MKIYLTHCCAKKNDAPKGTGRKVTPDILYTATPTKRFMRRCRQTGVRWAIFSDLQGVWFPDVEHEWYEKDPGSVTDREFEALLRDFESKLRPYSEIYFYHNPGRFHRLYSRLLEETSLRERVVKISHLSDIC
jgi:hypothetical protein